MYHKKHTHKRSSETEIIVLAQKPKYSNYVKWTIERKHVINLLKKIKEKNINNKNRKPRHTEKTKKTTLHTILIESEIAMEWIDAINKRERKKWKKRLNAGCGSWHEIIYIRWGTFKGLQKNVFFLSNWKNITTLVGLRNVGNVPQIHLKTKKNLHAILCSSLHSTSKHGILRWIRMKQNRDDFFLK